MNPFDLNPFWKIKSKESFERLALDTFEFQYENNTVYRSYCDLINRSPSDMMHSENIPFLPVSFFKSMSVISFKEDIVKEFSSSTTTSSIASKHFLRDLNDYKLSFRNCFERFYGSIEGYVVLALLPSYADREGSSLTYMVSDLIAKSNKLESGFYLNEWDLLKEKIIDLEERGQKTLLIGVSFALLDLIEKYTFQLKNTVVMETGGMKGRRKELTRSELHQNLSKGFGVEKIHSEYGMTELLSQAYSKGDGRFSCPPWMFVNTRESEDPFQNLGFEKTGGLNIIDLANRDSCSFIATQDLGKTFSDGTFEVLGRFDDSEIRGCNLMVF